MPSAPTNLNVTTIDEDRLGLSWTNHQPFPDFYDYIEIWRAQGGDSGYTKIKELSGSQSSYTDPYAYPSEKLIDGTRYYYFIRAYYAGEYADSSHEYGETELPAPSNLSVTVINPNKITLTWTNNSSVYDWVLIERKETCPGSTSWSQVGGPSGGNESWNDNTVKDGRTYEYRIRAQRGTIYSNYSGTDSGTTNLKKPTNLVGQSSNDGTYVDLTWGDPSETEDGYEIYRDGVKVHTTGENEKSWRDTGVSPKTTYYYKVRAIGPCNDSAYTAEIEVYTDAPPNAPSNLEAEAAGTDKVDLSWNDNSDDEQGFKIEEKVGAGSFSQIDTVGPNETSYQRTGLSPGTNYTYRVRAYNAAGNSDYSNEAEVTTQSNISKPTNPAATPVSDTEIEITFQDNSSEEDDHRLERKPDGGSYSEIKTLEPNRTYYKDTGLTKGQKYWYRVRAKQGANYSDYSDEVSATTISEPSGPSNLAAGAESDEKIRLTWNGVDNETGYKIEKSENEGSSWEEIAVIGADIEEFLVTGLSPNTRYDFRIRAYNAAGNSSYSNTAYTTTDAEYQRTAFEVLCRNPNAELIFLAEMNPKMRVQGFSLVSGKTYTYEYTITERGIDIEEVLENGTTYTEKSSITEVESNASSFYCDYYNRKLYVHTSDGSAPSNFYIEASFWLYFSTFQTKDGDIIFNGNYYFPYLDLANIPDVKQSIRRLYEGRTKLSSGDLVIRNPKQGDGEYFWDKKFDKYTFLNRKIRLKAGGPNFSYSQFKTIYTGLIGSKACEDRQVTFALEDMREGLSRQLPTNKFWTSNYSGLADTEQGRPIPVLFGSITNAPLVLIDSTNKKYKFHDGRVKSVTAVKDKDGTTLTENTDYYVDLQNAIITFDRDNYTIGDDDYFTIDFEGIPDSAGDLIQNGGDIFKYIYNEFLGLSNLELDLDSIYQTKYEKEKNLSIFMHLQKSSNTYIKEIETSLEAYSFQTEEGKIGLLPFSSTVSSDVKYIENHQIFGFKQEKKRDDILYQVNLYYDENPQDQSWSVKQGSSNTIQWAYRITKDIDLYVRLATGSEVQTVLNAILNLINKSPIEFSVRNILYACNAGDLVKFSRDRYYNSDGSATEKSIRIIEIEKSYSTGKISIIAEEVE